MNCIDDFACSRLGVKPLKVVDVSGDGEIGRKLLGLHAPMIFLKTKRFKKKNVCQTKLTIVIFK